MLQEKLNELQKTLMDVLAKKGLLHIYGHEKDMARNDGRPSKRAHNIRSFR